MPRAVAQIDVQNVDDLDPKIPTPIGGWRLYNGRGEWFEAQVGGRFYQIPPDKGSTPENPIYVEHPIKDDATGEPVQVEANGILNVDDFIGRMYRKGQSGGPTSFPTEQYSVMQSARDICQVVIRNYGQFGIALLKGTNQDERIKANARKLWKDSQIEKDKAAVAAYEANFATWKKNHPEQMAPPPPEEIRIAKERLDELKADKLEAFMYVCECGSYATNEEAKYIRHARLNHGKIIAPGGAEKRFNSEEPAKRRGRPPKEAQAV